ncbi:MAG: UDP-N-acetylmuramate dehydrogenase [Bacteroidales bacterium]
MHLDQKISLKAFHTFGMEVEARYFVEAKTHSEVLTLLNYRHMIHMPILFLGGGSNVLFTKDFGGIVIRINSKGITIREEDENQVLVTAEAGENWDEFVSHCVDRGWAGLENLSLIPGTVGAAPIQNIGAYGVEVKDVIEAVQVIEISSGKQKRYTNAECQFGYRDSIFKRELKGKVIILNVTFRLMKVTGVVGDKVTGLQGDRVTGQAMLKLDYGDIRKELAAMGIITPEIGAVRNAVCNIRRRKLPDPAEIGNAGSFFKNPVINHNKLIAIQKTYPDVPFFSQQNNENDQSDLVKVPAAWLIDQCGWKGFRDGDAGVHPLQPLVLVNYGAANGKQILGLANRVLESVAEKFGIRLEMEVNVIG